MVLVSCAIPQAVVKYSNMAVQRDQMDLLELALPVADMFIKLQFELKLAIGHAEALKFSLSLFILILPSLPLIG